MKYFRNLEPMTSTLSISLAPMRFLVLLAGLALGFSVSLTAHAASAQISANPTTISAGQSTQVSWSCSGSTSAFLYTNEGSSPVALSGSDTFAPTATFEYRVVCTDSVSSTDARVWVYVDEGACYQDWSSEVQGDQVYTVFDERNAAILEQYAMEGGGSTGQLYDSSNYYQQCIAACLNTTTKRCNLHSTYIPAQGEQGVTTMTCSEAVPGSSTQSKPYVWQVGSNGDLLKEEIHFSIRWDQATGGTCEPLPPAPTVDLTATPSSISSGGTSKLTWTSTNADSCTTTNFNGGGALNNATTGVNVSPATTTDYRITCVNSAGTASDVARVTVGSTPDLVAGSILPTTVTTGVSVTLNATTTNSGSATTGTSFSVMFQRATSASGSNATTLGTTSTATLPSTAGSNSRNVSYVTSATAFPTTGTWYVRACADKRHSTDAYGQIVESNESNNCGAWTAVTAAAGSNYPNLTAGTPSPSTAVVSTATTFSSTVTNSSATSTGRTFTNLFQFDNNADHTTVYDTRTDGSPILAGGATDTTSVSYTFNATGTWYVRTCADNNSSMAGVVTESNEADNCSSWRTVTVDTAAGTGTLSCTVNRTSVAVGGSVSFSASPTGLTPYDWVPSETGTVLGTHSASQSRTYATAGFYGMTVTSSDGRVASCPTVTVGNPCSNPQLSVTATPDRVRTGGTSSLTVSATGVSGSCTLSGPGVSQTLVSDQCSVDEIVVPTGAILTQSTFTLTCGADSAQAVVNVIPSYEVF